MVHTLEIAPKKVERAWETVTRVSHTQGGTAWSGVEGLVHRREG